MKTSTGHTTFSIKQITGFILLLALSAVFLFSAIAKLWFIQPFEWSFTDILPINITAAAVIARLFIGLEFMLGLFLLAHIFLEKFTYRATLILLVLFTIYLVLLLIKTGNNGNCGCFGEVYAMSPLAAIGKNLAMIAATLILMRIYPVSPYRKQAIVGLSLLAASFTIPFVVSPVYIFSSSPFIHEAVNLNPLYKYAKPAPAVDLRKGKHIIAFFSLTCPHCKHAAYHMQVLNKQYPDMPFYAVLGGKPLHLKEFSTASKLTTLPHTLLEHLQAFTNMAGNSVPAIYWVNDGIIEKKSYVSELEPGTLKKWLTDPVKH